jgi:hypothetical protein
VQLNALSQDYISSETHPPKKCREASYFFEADGDRVAVFIVDMQTPEQIPALAEPLFQWMGAKVEFHPVMSFEDLKKSKPKTIIDTYA